ncbi:unnamed protein product (macronuclear) [Paramecium tetraurelia]|uniref:Uncharacterized protein n=1 Tax=Paramecium tetraurelia TaxID=5888 RepID=A0CHW1_PARTE|nr:uncharacterized protein GSPATT00038480001 [Paramecium tetraurelia]CAK70378.1 unnamed protein product [Paramecium tetraurelia]|eukprot:XP_001437775.1 hypothetical protein (macronuclear) [Paramecium tetraurelia strain d4-2]
MNSTIIKIALAQCFKIDYKNKVSDPDQYDNFIESKGPQYTIVPRRPISKSFQGLILIQLVLELMRKKISGYYSLKLAQSRFYLRREKQTIQEY